MTLHRRMTVAGLVASCLHLPLFSRPVCAQDPPPHRLAAADVLKGREAAVDLTWWWSNRTQFTVGYTFQRLKNPGQVSQITPFVESFAAGVEAQNHLFWTSLAMQF